MSVLVLDFERSAEAMPEVTGVTLRLVFGEKLQILQYFACFEIADHVL